MARDAPSRGNLPSREDLTTFSISITDVVDNVILNFGPRQRPTCKQPKLYITYSACCSKGASRQSPQQIQSRWVTEALLIEGDIICDNLEQTTSATIYHDILFFLASSTNTSTNVPPVHSSEIDGLLA
jgi:hypothetical protein